MRIFTARYPNRRIGDSEFVPIGITVGRPRFRLSYEVAAYLKQLAPTGQLFSIEDEDEFKKLYTQKLDRIGAEKIREMLGKISAQHGGKDVVLLCFEDIRKPGQWCHRRLFSQWWQQQTREEVEELEE